MHTEVADDSLTGLKKLLQDILVDVADVKRLTADVLNAHTGAVLIVDDQPDVLKIFSELLSRDDRLWQMETLGAESFEKAETIIKTHKKLALGIFDYHLNNGITCQQLSDALLDRGIPVIIISGNPSDAEAYCKEKGIPLLAKPVNYNEVYSRACYLALKNKMVSRSKSK